MKYIYAKENETYISRVIVFIQKEGILISQGLFQQPAHRHFQRTEKCTQRTVNLETCSAEDFLVIYK